MSIAEPAYSTEYRADVGEDPATGARITEPRTLRTVWGDLDPTPWEQVADKPAATAAVRRYHDALIAINEMRAEEREAALSSIGDLSGVSFDAVVTRVEAAARGAGTSRG